MQAWREHMDEVVEELLGQAVPGEPFDVISGLAAPLPVRVICELVGADPAQAGDFRRWADAMTRVDERQRPRVRARRGRRCSP